MPAKAASRWPTAGSLLAFSPLPVGEGLGVRVAVEESPRQWADRRPATHPKPLSPRERGITHPA